MAGERRCARRRLMCTVITVGLAASGLSLGSVASARSSGGTVDLPPGAKYVAMGSSYAAGIGVPENYSTCARSDHNYPHLVATNLNLSLVDVSCSAALTKNLIDTAQGDNPPQVQAVTPDTALVTVTVGGNDLGYIVTALNCGGSDQTLCRIDPVKLDADFATLEQSFTALIDSIRERAPKAEIVFVTYPRLVPPTDCPALTFTPEGAALVGSIGARLEAVTKKVAKANAVRIATPYAAGDGHGPCEAVGVRWVEGKEAVRAPFAYHPDAAGHTAMAVLVKDSLTGKKAKKGTPASRPKRWPRQHLGGEWVAVKRSCALRASCPTKPPCDSQATDKTHCAPSRSGTGRTPIQKSVPVWGALWRRGRKLGAFWLAVGAGAACQ